MGLYHLVQKILRVGYHKGFLLFKCSISTAKSSFISHIPKEKSLLLAISVFVLLTVSKSPLLNFTQKWASSKSSLQASSWEWTFRTTSARGNVTTSINKHQKRSTLQPASGRLSAGRLTQVGKGYIRFVIVFSKIRREGEKQKK